VSLQGYMEGWRQKGRSPEALQAVLKTLNTTRGMESYVYESVEEAIKCWSADRARIRELENQLEQSKQLSLI
jgi:hypothetical protein